MQGGWCKRVSSDVRGAWQRWGREEEGRRGVEGGLCGSAALMVPEGGRQLGRTSVTDFRVYQVVDSRKQGISCS